MQLDADLVEWNYGTDEGRPPAEIDQERPGQQHQPWPLPAGLSGMASG